MAGIEEAALEARLIVEHFTQTSRTDAIVRPDQLVGKNAVDAVGEALARRIDGVPVFRILGRRDFHGVSLMLSSETLDPRPDTETLVELVLPFLRETSARNGECRILDRELRLLLLRCRVALTLPQERGELLDGRFRRRQCRGQPRVVGAEEPGRGDVVVVDRLPGPRRSHPLRQLRPQGGVIEEDVVRLDERVGEVRREVPQRGVGPTGPPSDFPPAILRPPSPRRPPCAAR